jgi:hypothetical protein
MAAGARVRPPFLFLAGKLSSAYFVNTAVRVAKSYIVKKIQTTLPIVIRNGFRKKRGLALRLTGDSFQLGVVMAQRFGDLNFVASEKVN